MLSEIDYDGINYCSIQITVGFSQRVQENHKNGLQPHELCG
jgi:hypothetical protein